MIAFLARRIPQALITLFLVTVAVSLLVALMPGDPATIAAGDVSDPKYIAELREDLGLNEGIVPRYADYMGNLVQGDLGESASMSPGVKVTTLIERALPPTLSLLFLAMCFAIGVSIPAGYLAATRQGGLIDRSVTAASSVLLAIPPFVIGVVLVTVFAVDRSWLPALGYEKLGDGFWGWFSHLILPAIALGAVSAAEMTRQVRSSFLDTLEQDYVRTADAKGMGHRSIVWKHAFKNAATPVLTVAGIQIPRIVGGAVVVEVLFAMSGFGLLAFNSVERRDIAVMQGVALVGAILVIISNLLTDIGVAYLNPKSETDD